MQHDPTDDVRKPCIGAASWRHERVGFGPVTLADQHVVAGAIARVGAHVQAIIDALTGIDEIVALQTVGAEQVGVTEFVTETILIGNRVPVAVARSDKGGNGRLDQKVEVGAAMNERIIPG